jgi:hypothetical protein
MDTNEDRLKNFILNRIFEELKQADTNRHYIAFVLDRQIIKSRWFNIGIIIVSAVGALATIIFKNGLWATIASGIVAFSTILNNLYPIFFLKSEDISKLTKLYTETYNYFNKIQDLFCLGDADKITPEETQIRFSELAEAFSTIATDISKIFGKINRKLQKKAVERDNEYLFRVYGVVTEKKSKYILKKNQKDLDDETKAETK